MTKTTTKNRITLKNIKVLEAASDETLCFEASMYFDGKRVAIVHNEGHGGCHFYDAVGEGAKPYDNPIHDGNKDASYCLLDTAFGWAESQTIIIDCSDVEDMDDFELEFDKMDHFVDERLREWEERKFYVNHCRRKTLFRLKGESDESWRTVNAAYGPEVKAWIESQYGDQVAEIANETRL